jgi:predicted dehydrogenase
VSGLAWRGARTPPATGPLARRRLPGRSHAAGYRAATTVFDNRLPAVRLVAIADTNQQFAEDAARRYGFERAEPSWEAVAEAPDVDAVSVVVGNALHREVAEGLMAAGKHVLCEKPLADTVAAGQAMVDACAGPAWSGPSATPCAGCRR